MLTSALGHLAVLLLALLTGGMLLIGGALVPYWESLGPVAFGQWFGENSSFLSGMMVPLGASTGLATVLTAAVAGFTSHPGFRWFALTALCAVFIGALYSACYAPTNAAIGSGDLSGEEISSLLSTWVAWHWTRVAAGIVGVLAGIRGLLATPKP